MKIFFTRLTCALVALLLLTACTPKRAALRGDLDGDEGGGSTTTESGGGTEEFAAGTGQVVDGDGALVDATMGVLNRIQRTLAMVPAYSVLQLADLNGCRGYGDRPCAPQMALTDRQRSDAAVLAQEATDFLLANWNKIYVRLAPGMVEGTDAAGHTVLVDARRHPQYWNLIEVNSQLVRDMLADTEGYARRVLEETIVHEMLHTATLPSRRGRLGDFDEFGSFTGDAQGREGIKSAAREIMSLFYRGAAPASCSLALHVTGMNVPVDIDNSPTIGTQTINFSFSISPARSSVNLRANEGSRVDWTRGAAVGTVYFPPSGHRTVLADVRDPLTGLTGRCESSVDFSAVFPATVPVFRIKAHMGGGIYALSYSTDGSAPPNWGVEGQIMTLLQSPTPRCAVAVGMLTVGYSCGIYSGTGSVLVRGSGSALIGYACDSPVGGMRRAYALQHRGCTLYHGSADPNELALLQADWTLITDLGSVY